MLSLYIFRICKIEMVRIILCYWYHVTQYNLLQFFLRRNGQYQVILIALSDTIMENYSTWHRSDFFLDTVTI